MYIMAAVLLVEENGGVQGSTLTVVRLHGASENGTQLVRWGK